MAKSCLYCCAATYIVLINIVFLLLGLAFLGVGIFLFVGGDFLQTLVKGVTENLPADVDVSEVIKQALQLLNGGAVALIICGAIILVISLVGMCGACCKSKVLLIVYIVCISVLLLAQVIVIAVYFSNNALFTEQARTYMKEVLKKYEGDAGKNFESTIWNILNIFMQCCGVDKGEDFKSATNWKDKSFEYNEETYNVTDYPLSCCKADKPPKLDDPENCIKSPETHSNKNIGCLQKLIKEIEIYFKTAAYCIGGICGFQALIITVCILMIMCMKKNSVA